MSKSKKAKIVTFPPPQLDEEAIRRIGSKLREHYDGVVAEPVPDRFAELLSRLESESGSDTHDK